MTFFASDETIADGESDTVTIPFPYIHRDHVKLRLGGTIVDPVTITWLDPNTVQLGSTPAMGAVIITFRATPVAQALVTFQPGVFSVKDLNDTSKFFLYAAQELHDLLQLTARVDDTDGQIGGLERVLKDVASGSSPGDAVNKQQLDDAIAGVETGGGGATDHGALTGLGDDDHTQYHTDGRADTWLGTKDSDDLTEGSDNLFMTQAEETKLAGVETGATADQTASEIATAYGTQVAIASQGEAEAGTGTQVRRWTPERVAQAIDALAPGGAGGDAWSDPVDADIIPDADGTRDLGSVGNAFGEVHTNALEVTGDIEVAGTVDGRDVAADGTKLDGVESGAQVNVIEALADDPAPTLTAALDGQGNAAEDVAVGIATYTSSHTLDATDAGKVVESNSGSAVTFTVPPNSSVPFAIGTKFHFVRYGAGTLTVAQGAGVTIRTPTATLTIDAQYGMATLYKRDTNEWVLDGRLTP